ncbi:MAG: prephenate dehydrogenase [Planctomycetota bacterium]
MTRTVGIVGVGLIGGSVAAAVKSREPSTRVVGFGRDAARLEACRSAGLIDEGRTDFGGAEDLDVAVVATPVDRIAADVRSVAAACRDAAVVTDAGSVKASIVADLEADPPERATFVGAHPLAGSAKQGFEHAEADLFDGRPCVVTPGAAPREAVDRVVTFWRGLGADVVELDPQGHDEALAFTSHLPHLVAAALAATAGPRADLRLASTGFGDTTRIAGGDPALWLEIVRSNRDAVIDALHAFHDHCGRVIASIDGEDDLAGLAALLEEGRSARRAFESLAGRR